MKNNDPRFQPDSDELSLHGYWALQQTVIGYCDKHRYPPWRFGKEFSVDQIIRWKKAFSDALIEFQRVIVYAEFWGPSATVHLCENEYNAWRNRQRGPSRHIGTLKVREDESTQATKTTKTTICPISLKELIATEAGVDALIYRLEKECIAPYGSEQMPSSKTLPGDRYGIIWTDSRSAHPLALQLRKLANESYESVVLPSAWGTSPDHFRSLGSLRLDHSKAFCVFDRNGRSGFVRIADSEIIKSLQQEAALAYFVPDKNSSPRYHYINDNGTQGVYEVAEELKTNAHGDWVCDVIDADGKQINPPGTRVLAETIDSEGCVLTYADDKLPRRVDCFPFGEKEHNYNSVNPEEPPNLRWLDVWGRGFSDMYLVQDPETFLWGWLAFDGSVSIAPQFQSGWHFHNGWAIVSVKEKPDCVGLIDKEGAWVVPPQWKEIIPKNSHFIIVQDADDQWGAINPCCAGEENAGSYIKMAVPLQPASHWLSHLKSLTPEEPQTGRDVPWSGARDAKREDIISEAITEYWHKSVRTIVKAAKEASSLEALNSLFDDTTTTSDLERAGLWFTSVEVLCDQTGMVLKPKKGERGSIFTQYPVGLSCFDLSVEAPVMGLKVQPEAVIGVPWKDLRALND